MKTCCWPNCQPEISFCRNSTVRTYKTPWDLRTTSPEPRVENQDVPGHVLQYFYRYVVPLQPAVASIVESSQVQPGGVCFSTTHFAYGLFRISLILLVCLTISMQQCVPMGPTHLYGVNFEASFCLYPSYGACTSISQRESQPYLTPLKHWARFYCFCTHLHC